MPYTEPIHQYHPSTKLSVTLFEIQYSKTLSATPSLLHSPNMQLVVSVSRIMESGVNAKTYYKFKPIGGEVKYSVLRYPILPLQFQNPLVITNPQH